MNVLDNLDKIKRLIIDNLLYDNVKYVYLAGSVMEGFGNETSDIDVYVIVDGDLDVEISKEVKGRSLKDTNNFVNNFIDNGIRYDYEYWSLSDWLNTINKLNNLIPEDPGFLKVLSTSDLDLLHRIKFAKPILNEECFLQNYSQINFENLEFYMASIKSEGYSNLLEDVEGALLSKDLKSAFIMVRLLLDETLSGFLAAHGETNPKHKWIYKKLSNYSKNSDEKEILNMYMNLLTQPKNLECDDELVHYIKSVIRFSQKLNIQTQNKLLQKEIKI
ncbi:nucleotidyltransferase domain-containing protein (plasmid) [Bacillus mycoides]|uniref:nucleotidyltransferase domain-containing protein n=1 Tax=Bacillus mycoides TaxID=1405 RepID=UPI003F74B7CD